MVDLDRQTGYWNLVGAGKTFSHPIALSWLAGISRQASVLDYGCGYGRLVGQLVASGFTKVTGVDLSAVLVARAAEEQPGARFAVLDDPPNLHYDDSSVDVVLLFAVLTCIPSNRGQRELVAELHRVLRPGGLLYLSDLCLQEDRRNLERYQRFAPSYRSYGVFETGDGAVCRHHAPGWFDELLADFDVLTSREVDVPTMNGHAARATQLLLTRP